MPHAFAPVSHAALGGEPGNQGYRHVTVNDTWRLRDKLGAKMQSLHQLSFSQCAGTSKDLHGNFPVGIVNRGGKLAFVARSGQIPTDCMFTMGPIDLPEGVAIAEMKFRREESGDKCGLAPSLGAAVTEFLRLWLFNDTSEFAKIQYGVYDATRRQFEVYDPRGWEVLDAIQLWKSVGVGSQQFTVNRPSVHGLINPYQLPLRQKANERRDILRPMFGVLRCDIAGSNDHEVAVILDSVKVAIPNGENF